MPTVKIPAPATVTPAPQTPTISLVPPTPEGPQKDKPASEQTFPDFSSNSQSSAHSDKMTLQSDSNTASKPVIQGVDEPMATSKSGTGVTIPESSDSQAPIASAQTSSLETRGPSPASFNFGPSTPAPPQPSSTSSLPFSLTPSSAVQLSEKRDDVGVTPPKSLFGGATTSFPGFGAPVSAPEPSAKPAAQCAEAATTPFAFPKVATSAAAESAEPLKPGFSLAQSPSLMPVSEPAPLTGAPKPSRSSTAFSFDQPAKETATAVLSTPAKNIFTFGTSSTTPSTAEKPAVTPVGFTLGSSTITSTGAPTGLSFGPPAAQSEVKPAASTEGFSFGTPAPALSNASKPGFSFGVTTPLRSLTPPPADDGMRMEESPTRGGRMDVNSGTAKPQSLPQLQMPGGSKPGFSFGSSTGTGFGSPSRSPFEGNSGSGFTFAQQSQPSNQGASGGFSFGTNKKESENLNGGFSFPTTKPVENATPTGFTFGQPTTDNKPSPSTGFAFSQPGPKTADATSSGFSFKAPEPIQHSTSFTFGQTLPEPVRPSSASAGFSFGQALPQQATTTAPFAFSSPASGGAFGSAPASPAFGTQPLAPASSTPFPFAGPTSAPPQQPAANPFGFGSGTGQPTSPAVQQGFAFNYGGGMPSTPTGSFGTSATQTQTPTTGNSGSPIFTMGAPSPQTAPPPPGARPVRKLPTRRNANPRR